MIHFSIDLLDTYFYIFILTLQWYKAVSCCHNVYLQILQQVSSEMEKGERYLIGDTTENREGNTNANGGEKEAESAAVSVPLVLRPPLERIREDWSNIGIIQEQYGDLYETVTLNFSMQQTPTNVKQVCLWNLM